MIYPELLGPDFEKMPRVLRDFHSAPGGGSASGTATVRRARNWLADFIGFPRAGDDVPLNLRVVTAENGEIWIRNFGGVELRTTQKREGSELLEAVGPVRITFRLVADERGMRFQSQCARLWFIRIPLRIEAREWGGDSSWEFEVTVAGVGSYRGRMVPAL